MAQSPEPSPQPPMYPEDTGVTFEPVGPSLWRVIEPEPDCERPPFYSSDGTAVAPDGRVWFLDEVRGIRELGSCPVLGAGSPVTFMPRAQVLTPDGTLWVLDGDRLMTWGGEDWVIHSEGQFNKRDCTALGGGPNTPAGVAEFGGGCSIECDEQACYFAMDVAAVGTVWLWGGTVAAFDGAEWTHYPEGEFVLGFGPDGDVWVTGDDGLYVIRPEAAAAPRKVT
jgi:hypothetical protein